MENIEKQENYSTAMPIWKLVGLILLTVGLYFFYWVYRNWKLIKRYKNSKKIWPLLFTFLPFTSIPFIDIVLYYFLFNQINTLGQKNIKKFDIIALILSLIIVIDFYGRIGTNNFLNQKEHFVFSIIIGLLILLIPMIIAQKKINYFFIQKETT